MSEANQIQNPPDNPKPANGHATSVLDWGFGPLLNAQADLLAGAEAAMTDWLHRRHEAVADTQLLIARMQIGADLADAIEAHQEFISRSFRRLAADADACHSAAQHLLDRAPNWLPEGQWTWFKPPGVTASTRAVTTHADTWPSRTYNQSD